jgi:hypothetical protein
LRSITAAGALLPVVERLTINPMKHAATAKGLAQLLQWVHASAAG